MLVPIGGDGTFLMAAGRASPLLADASRTPVVGFNSDPVRSEGRLMLPKQFSHDPRAAVRKIIEVICPESECSHLSRYMMGANVSTAFLRRHRVTSNGCADRASRSRCSARTATCRRPSICTNRTQRHRLAMPMRLRCR